MNAYTDRRRGFTLIELLIVVAIIAILAAIAVPNFLEAQTRAKISRAAADMRSIATALEAYAVDGNAHPPAANFSNNPLRVIWGGVPSGSVTTPIAYMSTLPGDPFATFLATSGSLTTRPGITPFGYEKAGFGWEGQGFFPDGPFVIKDSGGFVVQLPSDYQTNGLEANSPTSVFVRDSNETPRRWVLWSIGPFDALVPRTGASTRYYLDGRYDPTNGTVSPGYLLRYEGGPSFPAK